MGSIDEIDQAEEIFNYLRQSNISKKNITRLQNQEISELANIVLEVGANNYSSLPMIDEIRMKI